MMITVWTLKITGSKGSHHQDQGKLPVVSGGGFAHMIYVRIKMELIMPAIPQEGGFDDKVFRIGLIEVGQQADDDEAGGRTEARREVSAP